MLKINQLYFTIDGYENQLFCQILIIFLCVTTNNQLIH